MLGSAWWLAEVFGGDRLALYRLAIWADGVFAFAAGNTNGPVNIVVDDGFPPILVGHQVAQEGTSRTTTRDGFLPVRQSDGEEELSTVLDQFVTGNFEAKDGAGVNAVEALILERGLLHFTWFCFLGYPYFSVGKLIVAD